MALRFTLYKILDHNLIQLHNHKILRQEKEKTNQLLPVAAVLVFWKSEPPKPARVPPKDRPVEAVVVGAVVPPKFKVKPVVPAEEKYPTIKNKLNVDTAFKVIYRKSEIKK